MGYSITQQVLTLSPWHLKLHSKRSCYTLSSSTRRQNSITVVGVMLSHKVFHGKTSAVVKQNHRIAAALRVKIIVHKYLHFLLCICNASVCNGLYCKNELTSSWLRILTFLCGQGRHCCNLIFPKGMLTKQIYVGISDWNTWIARISEEIMSGSLPLWPCPSIRSRRNFISALQGMKDTAVTSPKCLSTHQGKHVATLTFVSWSLVEMVTTMLMMKASSYLIIDIRPDGQRFEIGIPTLRKKWLASSVSHG